LPGLKENSFSSEKKHAVKTGTEADAMVIMMQIKADHIKKAEFS